MTRKPVIPREQATRDIEHAIDHYLGEGAAQAASDLIGALRAAYRPVGLHPGIGSPRYGYELDIPGLRGKPLERFPYTVVYVERTGHIDVLRILHQHRDIPELLRDLGGD